VLSHARQRHAGAWVESLIVARSAGGEGVLISSGMLFSIGLLRACPRHRSRCLACVLLAAWRATRASELEANNAGTASGTRRWARRPLPARLHRPVSDRAAPSEAIDDLLQVDRIALRDRISLDPLVQDKSGTGISITSRNCAGASR